VCLGSEVEVEVDGDGDGDGDGDEESLCARERERERERERVYSIYLRSFSCKFCEKNLTISLRFKNLTIS
jgi:hypothetical protein